DGFFARYGQGSSCLFHRPKPRSAAMKITGFFSLDNSSSSEPIQGDIGLNHMGELLLAPGDDRAGVKRLAGAIRCPSPACPNKARRFIPRMNLGGFPARFSVSASPTCAR